MALITSLILVLVTAALLMWQFPLALTMATLKTELSTTERSYLFVVLLLPALSITANMIAARWKLGRAIRAVLTLLLSVMLGSAVCLALGLGGFEVPTTAVREIFFAGERYVKVFLFVVLPLSVVTAVTTTLRSLWVMSAGQDIEVK